MEGKKDKATILVIVLGLSIIGLVTHRQPVIWTGVSIGVLSMLSSKIEGLIIFLWMRIAQVLGFINTKILLSLAFFLVLVPMSFLKRIFSRSDSLKLKKPALTTWVSRDHLYTKEDIEETF